MHAGTRAKARDYILDRANEVKDLRKLLIVLLATIVGLLVTVVRAPRPVTTSDTLDLDASWVMGLAASFQQGQLSGRDFNFPYGPLAQMLAAGAVNFNKSGSPIAAMPLIVVALMGSAGILLACVLVLYDRITWQQTFVVYTLAALLNLFSEPTSFRMLILVLCAAELYRAVTARSRKGEVIWAIVAGVTSIAAQLTTLEIGLYCAFLLLVFPAGASLTIRFAASSGHDAKPFGRYLLISFVSLAVFTGLNVAVAVFFRLSSSSYPRLFSYHTYAWEILRGYNRTLGAPWQLPVWNTIGLVSALVYSAVSVIVIRRRLKPADLQMLLSLGLAALVALKSALLRSDIGHITVGTGPAALLLIVLGQYHFPRLRELLPWAAMVVVLLLAWPWAGLFAFKDLAVIAAQPAEPFRKIRLLASLTTDPYTIVPAELSQALPENTRVLVFPYGVYFGIALQRPMFSPLLEAYAATTIRLQDYYVRSLQDGGKDVSILYVSDEVGTQMIDRVPNVTRFPAIFSYLYRNYELYSPQVYGNGFVVLQRRESPRPDVLVPEPFETGSLGERTTEIRLKRAATCDLIQLKLEVAYPVLSSLARPGEIYLTVLDDDRELQTIRVLPVDARPFVTILSLVPPEQFHSVFKPQVFHSQRWNNIRFHYLSPDYLSIPPSIVRVSEIGCMG